VHVGQLYAKLGGITLYLSQNVFVINRSW